jgi:hypothetical protein
MSNEKHKDFLADLNILKDSAGWKILEKVLIDNIKDTENEMFDEELEKDDPAEEMKRLSRLKKERKARRTMLELPNSLINTYKDPVNFEKDFDPYD